jgi:NhaP-type Na+/H+ or K+/H+ antiporter
VFALSCLIGAGIAALAALVFKVCKIAKEDGSSASTEVAIMTLFVWVSYLLPEAMEMSGICAILFAGVFMKKYLFPNLSHHGQELAEGIFELFASVAESATFVFLGIAPFSFASALGNTAISTYVVVLVLAMASRYFAVSSTVGIANLFRHRNRIPSNYTRILQLCGFRGSMALALGIRAKSDFPENGDSILASTVVLGIFTVLLMGTIVPKAMTILLADAPTLPGASGADENEKNKAVVSGYGGLMKKVLVKVNDSVLESTLTVRSHNTKSFADAAALFEKNSTASPSNSRPVFTIGKSEEEDEEQPPPQSTTDHPAPAPAPPPAAAGSTV